MKSKSLQLAVRRGVLGVAMLMACGQTLATRPSEESHRLVHPNDVVGALGSNAFGEEVNQYTGSLSFRHTDVSLPGNDDLPMTVGRRYTVEGTGPFGGGASRFGGGMFGDWDIDLPVIHGTFAASGAQGVRGFKVQVPGGLTIDPSSIVGFPEDDSDARCSQFGPPPDYKGLPLSTYVIFSSWDYWHGTNLYVPGAGDREILKRSPQNTLAPGGQVSNYPLVTTDHWQFGCLPTLANDQPGEGFLARSPSGMTYRFDWLVYRPVDGIFKSDSASASSGNGDESNINPDPWSATLARVQALLYPTRITDRFGNSLTLNWSGSKLISMIASDGRQLTFHYDNGNTVTRISDGTRSWQYGYSNGALVSLTLPDNSAWQFGLSGLQKEVRYAIPPQCDYPGSLLSNSETSGTIKHPSGATATFTIRPVTHGSTWVYYSCDSFNQRGPSALFTSLSLVRKTISGPGLVDNPTWTYDYDSNHCWTGKEGVPAPVCSGRTPTTKQVTITGPDNAVTVLHFSNHVGHRQGKLLRTDYLDGGALVRQDINFYDSPEGKAFPDPVGLSITDRGDPDETQRIHPSANTSVTISGRYFSKAATQWDVFGNATKMSLYSGSIAKSEDIAYENNTALWVIGLTRSVKDVGSGKFESETIYDAATALPIERKAFGRTEATFGYCTAVSTTCAAKGLMSWSRDGAGAQTRYQNHHRGIPQKVIFPDNKSVTGTVSDQGWVTSYTDEIYNTTSYQYDPMGRLKSIEYPRDTQAWDVTAISFAQQSGSEYGIGGGHWKQSVTTGRYRKETIYDALWRPVLTREWDTQSSGSDRYTVRAFDAAGRETFASYPTGGVTTVSASVQSNQGVSKTYDALGRLRSSAAYSEPEHGLLTTLVDYESDYVKRVRNPRGQVTRIEYMQFEPGSEALPTRIDVRDSMTSTTPLVTIDIGRDTWGKPLSITRSGSNPAVSATRGYVYDSQQRLCKLIEPEYGAEIYQLDDAGRIVARAKSPTLTGFNACNVANVPASAWINHGYDPRGRLLSTDYPDNTADESRTYYPNGALWTVKRGSGAEEVRWTYEYNSRGQVTEERILIDVDQSAANTYGYDSLGNLRSLRFLNGPWVYYAPNAFGQPTEATLTIPTEPTRQIHQLASNVSYYPNGAMSGFTYGNGVWHYMTPNERGLPKRSVDQIGNVKWVHNTYAYDENGNPTSIDDALNIDDKTLNYDMLDRLVGASGGFGQALMQYDGLDRLTRYSVNTRDWRYWYDGSQRLDTVTNAQGATQVDLDHDVRGNVLSRSRGGGWVSFGYDRGDRVVTVSENNVLQATYRYDGLGRRTKTTKANGDQRFQIYTQGGQFVWEGDFVSSEGTARGVNYVNLNGSLIAKLVADWELPAQRTGDGRTPKLSDVFRNVFADAGATAIVAPADGSTAQRLADVPVTYHLRYVHTDALGSPVLETNADGQDIDGTRTLYEPYGTPLTTPPDGAPSFTGHQYDTGTGLIYAQQRYYDPQLGVFMSPDPMAVDTTSAFNFNRYAYANNSPYKFTDPDGRNPWNSSQYHEPDTYVRQSTSSESSGSVLIERRREKLVGAGSIEVRNSGSVRLLPQASANGAPAKVGDEVMSKLLNFSDKEKKTVEVTSGERTPEQNRAVGGAARSQHLQNNAADIRIAGYSKTATADAAHASGEFNRVNEYPDGRGVHVDLKDYGTQGRFDNWQRRDEQ